MLALVDALSLAADPGFARGVYVDHSVTLQSARYVGYDVHAAIVRRVDSVARCNVNVAWVTNLPNDAGVVADYVATFRARGIDVVAGSGYWYAYQGRSAEQFARLRSLHDALPVTSRPWRWPLGDETTLDALTDLRSMADACKAAGIPATMVQVPEYHSRTVDALGTALPSLACDVYPFFQPGLSSNPPYGPAALNWCRSTTAATIRKSRTVGITPLVMCQGFSQQGLFVLPSPARVRWQIWTAAAMRSDGVIVFAHGTPRDTGMESLINWDQQTEALTPQGDAVAATFARLKLVDSSLLGSVAEASPAWASPVQAGDSVTIVRTTEGKRLLMIVADPDAAQRTIKVTLPGVTSVTPMASSTGGSYSVLPWPWYLIWPGTFSATLQPGDCWIGEIW